MEWYCFSLAWGSTLLLTTNCRDLAWRQRRMKMDQSSTSCRGGGSLIMWLRLTNSERLWSGSGTRSHAGTSLRSFSRLGRWTFCRLGLRTSVASTEKHSRTTQKTPKQWFLLCFDTYEFKLLYKIKLLRNLMYYITIFGQINLINMICLD